MVEISKINFSPSAHRKRLDLNIYTAAAEFLIIYMKQERDNDNFLVN